MNTTLIAYLKRKAVSLFPLAPGALILAGLFVFSSCGKDEENPKPDFTKDMIGTHQGIIERKTGSDTDPIYYYTGSVTITKVDATKISLEITTSLDGTDLEKLSLPSIEIRTMSNGVGMLIPQIPLSGGGSVTGGTVSAGDPDISGAFYEGHKKLEISLEVSSNGKTYKQLFTTDTGDDLTSSVVSSHSGSVLVDNGSAAVLENASITISKVNNRTIKIAPQGGNLTSTFYASIKKANFEGGKSGFAFYIFESTLSGGGTLEGNKISTTGTHHGFFISEGRVTGEDKVYYSLKRAATSSAAVNEGFENIDRFTLVLTNAFRWDFDEIVDLNPSTANDQDISIYEGRYSLRTFHFHEGGTYRQSFGGVGTVAEGTYTYDESTSLLTLQYIQNGTLNNEPFYLLSLTGTALRFRPVESGNVRTDMEVRYSKHD